MRRDTKGLIPWKSPPAKRVGLLDADGILWAAALKGVTLCDGEQLQVLEDEEILQDALERLNVWDHWLGECGTVFVCLSARETFRKRLLPSYKGNRKEGSRPITLDALRNAFMSGETGAGFKTVLIKDLEADDVCGIVATSFQARGYETCIVSPDKDLLSIPGMVLTPRVGKDPVFSEVSQERADYWHMYQTLVGDTCDNYKGCPGFGPVKADKLLGYCADKGFSAKETWGEIVDQFRSRGLTEEDALVQARVARILRKEDWDEKRKEVRLWQPR